MRLDYLSVSKQYKHRIHANNLSIEPSCLLKAEHVPFDFVFQRFFIKPLLRLHKMVKSEEATAIQNREREKRQKSGNGSFYL